MAVNPLASGRLPATVAEHAEVGRTKPPRGGVLDDDLRHSRRGVLDPSRGHREPVSREVGPAPCPLTQAQLERPHRDDFGPLAGHHRCG